LPTPAQPRFVMGHARRPLKISLGEMRATGVRGFN
jgi:hypothetical protein